MKNLLNNWGGFLLLMLLLILGCSSCKPSVTVEEHNKSIDSVKILFNLLKQDVEEIKSRKPIKDTVILKTDNKARNEFKRIEKFTPSDRDRFRDSVKRANNIK